MSALPGTPAIQNAIPMPFFGTTPFAAPGLGIIASLIILAFGLWWLWRAESAARAAGEGYGPDPDGVSERVADNEFVRERATAAREFDRPKSSAAIAARPPRRSWARRSPSAWLSASIC